MTTRIPWLGHWCSPASAGDKWRQTPLQCVLDDTNFSDQFDLAVFDGLLRDAQDFASDGEKRQGCMMLRQFAYGNPEAVGMYVDCRRQWHAKKPGRWSAGYGGIVVGKPDLLRGEGKLIDPLSHDHMSQWLYEYSQHVLCGDRLIAYDSAAVEEVTAQMQASPEPENYWNLLANTEVGKSPFDIMRNLRNQIDGAIMPKIGGNCWNEHFGQIPAVGESGWARTHPELMDNPTGALRFVILGAGDETQAEMETWLKQGNRILVCVPGQVDAARAAVKNVKG